MATKASKTRVHEGRDKLPGPSRTALIHRTGTGATYICHTVTGAYCFCVRRVLRPPSQHSAGWPRLHACEWLELRACPAGKALSVISAVHSTWYLRAERASCIRSLRSGVRPRPQCHHASRCTRAVGVPGANDPVARMQLYHVNVLVCLNRHMCSAYALRSTSESSDHGGRGT
jgi:hypothetical protein